jgi:hypothetical protein
MTIKARRAMAIKAGRAMAIGVMPGRRDAV